MRRAGGGRRSARNNRRVKSSDSVRLSRHELAAHPRLADADVTQALGRERERVVVEHHEVGREAPSRRPVESPRPFEYAEPAV